MFYNDTRDLEQELTERMTAEWLMDQLEPAERDILYLWAVEDRNFEDIGKIVGLKHFGEVLPGTKIRYRKDKLMRKLRAFDVAADM